MRAIELQTPGGVDNLRMVERPMPEPGRQEMIVRVKATALNYRDVEIVRGSYHTAFPLPLVPLSDGVGEVVAIGAEVSRFKVGDRVCGAFWQRWVGGGFAMAEPSYQRGGPIDGLLSEFTRLDEQAAVLAPAILSDVEAATLPCAAVTAWHALFTEGSLKPGETVLCLGTGSVSLFAVQFAAAAGARVIVTSSSDEKLAMAKQVGAHDGVNYRTDIDWASGVLALTDGRGADHIIEVGGPQSFAQSLKAAARGAQINVIGYLGGSDGAINPLDIFRRQVKARGIPVGSRESFEAMNRAIAVNRLRPVIDRVLPWSQAAEAFRYLDHGSPFGKVVLDHTL
ncbi:NAD(P)-dependent alcohol dehydrogenase [Mesorhizobium sp. M00.F.Ca.ET.216.01.1.1]|uniref:zinc-dependent alcohol dehydrogenase family protein n=1 Tax=Mesorhizobium sp. M00.F.Ca.ET.216.01.1.1 TaxID=2500528 RepID=UPI000FD6F061|nr:NAD(P)-dependent alcohol dehydrogenase [Mesorhizobium sp. M00.F.Ca.ET.216.01.1.1]TGQ44019.1 NAD(P)-dependent alcohol dehydrogenase [Mesorhizobium sp. M00.F.Ca.ET.216.01.1.1]TJW48555.1 MAG: NAD(P)-dependent alcohol dehydrogenase [Mesorhizobium sp.]